MIAALGTLVFLTTLWMVVVVGAALLEESGGKIAAALKGKSRQQISPAPIRMRTRSRIKPVMRAEPQWRAAA